MREYQLTALLSRESGINPLAHLEDE